MDEKEFRLKLAIDLEDRFGWDVYHHDKYKEYSDLEREINKFNIRYEQQPEKKGYPDLYCYTPFEEFPRIVIETKISDKLDTFTKAIIQVEQYAKDKRAIYSIDGEDVDRPDIVLLASPDSYYNGYLYIWAGQDPCWTRWIEYMHPMLEHNIVEDQIGSKRVHTSKVYKTEFTSRKTGNTAVCIKSGEMASHCFDFVLNRVLWKINKPLPPSKRKKTDEEEPMPRCSILKSDTTNGKKYFELSNKKYFLERIKKQRSLF